MRRKFTWISATITLALFILLFTYNSGYLAAKPTVNTAAAEVHKSSVTLTGMFKDGKKINQYGFKWGNSKELQGNKSLGNKIKANTKFSATINGLKAGNTYYYQAYAQNRKGFGYGEIKSFTVPNEAPVIKVSSPANQTDIIKGAVVHISASAADDRKVESMELLINGSAAMKVNEASITYDWNTSEIETGKYKILLTAWDGSKTGQQEISINVNEPVAEHNDKTEQTVLYNTDAKSYSGSYSNSNSNTEVSRGQTYTDISKYPLLSKVNGIFGQFRYRELGGGRIEVDPQWVANNIVTITLPGLNRQVQVNKKAADKFILAFTYIKNGTATINGRQVPLLSLINTMDGTYVTRHVNWDPSRGLSNHSWGTAIDINADNHFNYVDSPTDPNMILWEKAFKPAGFSWGNRYSDSMHYELIE